MLKKITGNFILYSFSFFISLYLHKGTISLGENYNLYYAAYMISWAISGLLARKYKNPKEFWLLGRLYTYTASFFLMLGILVFIIYKFDLTGVSRFVILNSLIISFFIEMGYLLVRNREKFNYARFNLTYSSRAFLFEFLLFGLINLFLIYKLSGNISFNSWNVLLFLCFYLSWFLGSFLGHQFHPRYKKKEYWSFIWQYLKSYAIILALSLFIAFVNRLAAFDILVIIYGIVFYSVLSFIGISAYYHIKRHRIRASNISGFPVKGEFGELSLGKKSQETNQHTGTGLNINETEMFNSKFKNFSLRRYPEVYEFLNKSIDLRSFDYSYSVILKSDNISGITYLPDTSVQFLLNLEKMNQIDRINEYLAEVNNKLVKEGIFSGNFETIYLRHQTYLKRYPYYFAQTFYFIDFLWNSVFMQMIFLKVLNSKLTRGSHKALSLAEGLGRLYFNGFEILHLNIIESSMFFIAKKKSEPFPEIRPSTGLIFKMNRIGKGGKPIAIYKIRTMHPYSEYLQGFVYEKFNLEHGGKFKNDFRITYWGRILRRLWIDELPMLYNWFKGDLKLVGPRPLSHHYFNLYSPELRAKRLKYKPGLIPPFYADNPKTFDEIMASEQKYLALYEKNHVGTDIKYFFLCIYNIVFKGARSS